MNRIVRVLLALIAGFAAFRLVQHFFQLSLATSLVLALFSTVAVGFGVALDALKRILDPIKLSLEISKLRREENAEGEKRRVVQLATPDEIKEYGQSIVERTLKERYRKTGKYLLEAKPFVIDDKQDGKN